MPKLTLSALVSFLMLTTGALAGPLEEGTSAYVNGDYDLALRLWRPLAEQGNAEAQWSLGLAYQVGRAVPQDYGEAVTWLRLAAEQGNGHAQQSLGWHYEKGFGVPKDYVQAHKWFNLATVARYKFYNDWSAAEAAEKRDQIASA